MVVQCWLAVLGHRGIAGRLSSVMQMVEAKKENSLRYVLVEVWGATYKENRFLEMVLGGKFLHVCRPLLIYTGDLCLPLWVRLHDWDV